MRPPYPAGSTPAREGGPRTVVLHRSTREVETHERALSMDGRHGGAEVRGGDSCPCRGVETRVDDDGPQQLVEHVDDLPTTDHVVSVLETERRLASPGLACGRPPQELAKLFLPALDEACPCVIVMQRTLEDGSITAPRATRPKLLRRRIHDLDQPSVRRELRENALLAGDHPGAGGNSTPSHATPAPQRSTERRCLPGRAIAATATTTKPRGRRAQER